MRLGKGCEECGERETPCFMRLGSTASHAGGFTKENGNRRRKRSLGCARDDETGEVHFTFFFKPLRKPTSAPSGHILPKEGGRAVKAIYPLSAEGEVVKTYPLPVEGGCPKGRGLASFFAAKPPSLSLPHWGRGTASAVDRVLSLMAHLRRSPSSLSYR